VKTLVLLALLVALATTPAASPVAMAGYGALLLAGILAAGLPVGGVLLRAGVVLPFAGTFALISALSGDAARAWSLVAKSYLSAVAVLLLTGTTPLPQLLRGLESMRVPRLLVLVVQFIHRYLFVISEQAQHMRQAAACRGSFRRGAARRTSRFQAAAGALSVLFARSYGRAEAVHRAMLSRGFTGRFPLLAAPAVTASDWAFLLLGWGAVLFLRAGLEA
jgi:cobalt/nickel transport system permease protein